LDLARRQHGHVARFQLLELGAAQGLIAGRLASGAWVAVHQGAYCIGPRRNDPLSRAAAAVLACGPARSSATARQPACGDYWPGGSSRCITKERLEANPDHEAARLRRILEQR
jgi:hypothetical protein